MRKDHLVTPLVLLCLGLVACGSAGRATHTTTGTAAAGGEGIAGATATSDITQGYLNDGDHDPTSDQDPDDRNGKGIDEDHDNEDNFPAQNHSYHDGDEDSIVNYGHPASPADMHAVTAVVKRYYAAAAAGNGARACSLMYPVFARAVPEDYGKAPGPLYLRGGTCRAVMSKLFKHLHNQLVGSFVVTSVRVSGKEAIALLGSTTAPARSIDLQRERGVWKVDALFAAFLH